MAVTLALVSRCLLGVDTLVQQIKNWASLMNPSVIDTTRHY